MNAGTLNEIIQIYRTDTVINEYAERYETLVLKYTTRANVSFDSGSRSDSNEEIHHVYDKTFKVRSYVPIVETDIIVWQSHKFRILSIEHRREDNNIIIRAEIINE